MFDYSEKSIEKAKRYTEEYEKTFCVGTSILNPCKPFMDLWYKISRHFPGYRMNIVPFEDDNTNILAEISALGERFEQHGWTGAVFLSSGNTRNALP